MDINQGRYSMSNLGHNYGVWLERGVALGEMLQRLWSARIFGQTRRFPTAGLTERVLTSQPSERAPSRKDVGLIDKQAA